MEKKERSVPEFLYHATRAGNLESILTEGLRTSRYGEVHGGMDYAPLSPCVYLSSREESGNLHASLFDGSDDVIVLRIRASKLDRDAFLPDDCFYYMLEEYVNALPEPGSATREDISKEAEGMAEDFARDFGVGSRERAVSFLTRFLEADGSMDSWQPIAKELAVDYLAAQGEAAYEKDVPPEAIEGWVQHPSSPLAEKKRIRPMKTGRKI